MRRLSTEFTRTLFSLLFLTILILAATEILLKATVRSSAPAYIKNFNVFRELFKDPYEVLVVIFRDWTGFAITTQDEGKVAVAESFIIEEIEERGKTPADILVIVHNHNDPSRFSEQNNHFYFYLKRQGFDGFFYIYYPHSGKVLEKK